MMVHQGFFSFFNCSSRFLSKLWPAKLYSKIKHGAQHMFCFEVFKHSSSCIPKCNPFYLIFWGGVISFLTIFIHVSRFTCCQERGILNPSISSLELSCVILHLKPSLRNVAIVVLINDPRFLRILLGERGFSSLRWSQASNCFSLVAEFHLKCWDVFHKPITTLFLSLLFFQQLHSIPLSRMLFKIHLW